MEAVGAAAGRLEVAAASGAFVVVFASYHLQGVLKIFLKGWSVEGRWGWGYLTVTIIVEQITR